MKRSHGITLAIMIAGASMPHADSVTAYTTPYEEKIAKTASRRIVAKSWRELITKIIKALRGKLQTKELSSELKAVVKRLKNLEDVVLDASFDKLRMSGVDRMSAVDGMSELEKKEWLSITDVLPSQIEATLTESSTADILTMMSDRETLWGKAVQRVRDAVQNDPILKEYDDIRTTLDSIQKDLTLRDNLIGNTFTKALSPTIEANLVNWATVVDAVSDATLTETIQELHNNALRSATTPEERTTIDNRFKSITENLASIQRPRNQNDADIARASLNRLFKNDPILKQTLLDATLNTIAGAPKNELEELSTFADMQDAVLSKSSGFFSTITGRSRELQKAVDGFLEERTRFTSDPSATTAEQRSELQPEQNRISEPRPTQDTVEVFE